jgi:hypothetical protein
LVLLIGRLVVVAADGRADLRFEDGLCSYIELFDLEDEVAARVAFVRLAAEEPVAEPSDRHNG